MEYIEKRFWKYVERNSKKKCWLWKGGKYPNGYGRANVNNHRLLAHRFSYMINIGHIETGLVIHHKCNTKLCVNPNHLEMLTPKENTKKYYSSGW